MQPRSTLFGRYHVAEPFRAELQHLYKGAPLKTVAWDIPIPVLDQEDLLSQGINTAQLIPGAQEVDALGSCTANATTASLSERYTAARKLILPSIDLRTNDGQEAVISQTDPELCEEFAIVFYDLCTHQTGDPSQEWPPTDCGSTGLYCCQELMSQKLISTYQTGTGGQVLASLLQAGSVIVGSPWFNSWMEPDSAGFIDGDGSMDALQAAMNSGVAGGHERCIYEMPVLKLQPNGQVDLQASWVTERNSWSTSWALSGDHRVHLSTLDWLSQSTDFKQFVL